MRNAHFRAIAIGWQRSACGPGQHRGLEPLDGRFCAEAARSTFASELDRSSVNGLSVAYMSRKTKRLIGYARVSTAGQDLARQVRVLKAERCAAIFTDTASGKSLEGRPQLGMAIASLAPGDTLLLAVWHRATESVWA